jgi:hypothetical protein
MSGIMLKMILLFTFIVILICIDIIAFITEDAASTKLNFVPLLDTDLLILFLSKCQVPFTHPSFTPAKKKS